MFTERPSPPQIKDKAKELENGKLTKVSKWFTHLCPVWSNTTGFYVFYPQFRHWGNEQNQWKRMKDQWGEINVNVTTCRVMRDSTFVGNFRCALKCAPTETVLALQHSFRWHFGGTLPKVTMWKCITGGMEKTQGPLRMSNPSQMSHSALNRCTVHRVGTTWFIYISYVYG